MKRYAEMFVVLVFCPLSGHRAIESLCSQSHHDGSVRAGAQPWVPEPTPTNAGLADGDWLLTRWHDVTFPDPVATVSVATRDGQKTAAVANDEIQEWQLRDFRVEGRLVHFRIGRRSEFDEFEGLLDPKDPTGVLGSLTYVGSVTRAQLVLVPVRQRGSRTGAEPADAVREWEEVSQLVLDDLAKRGALRRYRGNDERERRALADAAAEAARRYDAQVPQGLRQVYDRHRGTPVGYEAALMSLGEAKRLRATGEEVRRWADSARSFAVTHGPRFEAATVAKAAVSLARQPGYEELAQRLASEADALALAAGHEPRTRDAVQEHVEERAAWATGPRPPADEPWPATLVGVVRDERGRPIEGAEVLVNQMSWAPIVSVPAQSKARTDADGRYALTLLCTGDHRVHVRQMWAEGAGFVRAVDDGVHKILPGGAAVVNFTLRPGEILGGTLRLRKTGSDSPGADAVPSVAVLGARHQQYALVKDGRFELYVPPGTYEVRLDRGLRKYAWAGLASGHRDHVLEQPPFVYNAETLGAAFDELWTAIDCNYSYFVLKPDLDWKFLRRRYRPKACAAKDAAELVAVLKELLAHLKDGHVWIEHANGEVVGTHGVPWSYNGNRPVTLAQLTDAVECGPFATVGKTRPDGFGYFLLRRQSAATPQTVAQAAAAIDALRDAPGFVVDLRVANGGSEPLALEVARLFCAKEVVYAKSKYRNGQAHDDFSQDHPRVLPPAKSGKPYRRPVVCLLGPGCVSSGEGFAQMMSALPHVIRVGLPTRGSSGNPAPAEVGETGIRVYFSRWVDLLPDGTPIEGRGVPPAVRVDEPAEAYRDGDPTLSKALEVLRKLVADTPP
jgi:hypothetical protein